MPLTDRQASTARPAEKDYKLSDSGGLFLLVKKTGGKLWRLKYRINRKEKLLALGAYPEVSLKEARLERDAARRQISQRIDPLTARKTEQLARQQAETGTFEAIGREWFRTKEAEWSPANSERILSRLERFLFPTLGKRPLTDIEPMDLLDLLRGIEESGRAESAHRVRQYASQIFRFAIVSGRARENPASHLVGALKAAPAKKHHAAITTPAEAGRLLVAIDGFQGTAVVAAALKLAPLVFCRPGELRHLEWQDINWTENRIEIPAERMKMKAPHIIPLSRQSRAILASLEPLTGRFRYVFPSARGKSRPMSENALRTALRTLGYTNDQMTPHGFRAMARTLLDEVLGYRIDWIEHQLAHAVKDANGRAYNRTQHLKQRAEMLQRWADYLDQLKAQTLAGNVIPIREPVS